MYTRPRGGYDTRMHGESRPSPGGMGAAGIGGIIGRIYNPPLQTHAPPLLAVGAHFICARTASPVCRRLAGNHSCPTGGHKGRPYDIPSTRSVGRGAHTPPNLAAIIASCRRSSRRGGYQPPEPPPLQPPGPHSSQPGHGGMWACRPTRFGERAMEIAGLPGRIYNPPLQTHAPPLPVVGAHCICARAALPVCRRLAGNAPRSWRHGGIKNRPR